MGKKQRIAVFDVDGTVYRTSLFVLLVEKLIEKGEMTASKSSLDKFKKIWLDRRGPYEDFISEMVAYFMKQIQGVPIKAFENAASEIFDEHKNRTYKYTRDLISDLGEKGYYLIAISQSPKGVLDRFCRYLGFDKIYGRFYEVGPTDQFTGKVMHLHLIGNKANILKRAVLKNDLSLSGSIGVGDTEDDIPFLEMVDRPICFNPNKKLFRHAKINHWEVVVERKDMIYKIIPRD
jgi:HAD superfamily hydrolase (TIGR01490 family)